MSTRLNKYIAQSTRFSRRSADAAIAAGRISINGRTATLGDTVNDGDVVAIDGRAITPVVKTTTILFHKPAGYVVSRDGQGSRSIYDILPSEYHALNPVGRLDKDSSGLLVLTNDGNLAQLLSHPSQQKNKIYQIELLKPLQPLHRQMIHDYGVQLDDGPSRLHIERITEGDDLHWQITMHEGRNRQIRRTFEALGYTVVGLHRTHFGPHDIGSLASGTIHIIAKD